MSLNRIGQILNQEREHKGLTLKQVSEATCISCTQLEAVEKGDYSKLPAKAYIRGFIQAYCKVLDIDSAPLLSAFGAAHINERAKLKETKDLGKDFERLFTLGHVSLLLLIMVFSGLILWMRSHLNQYEESARKIQSIPTSDILQELDSKTVFQKIHREPLHDEAPISEEKQTESQKSKKIED